MRALTLRPDDQELFQNIANDERQAFFFSNLSAFKKMWTEEGNVYWLRFLMAFKQHFDNWSECQQELHFVLEMVEQDELRNHVFISIHKKFVHSSYDVAKSFMENVFSSTKHMPSLYLPKEMNPDYNKEAFDAIFGESDVVDDAPVPLVAFALSIYASFVGAVCALLKRWLKESDMSENAKKCIDFTYFYWKPNGDWNKEDFWATCFEKYLADTYKDELPKMLLTANIQNTFLENHEDDCVCRNYGEDMSLFGLFKEIQKRKDKEDFCIKHKGIVKPNVKSCNVHSTCYRKVLHDPKCSEPYLCEGSKDCKITCEKNIKLNSKSSPNLWKKIQVETFSSKEPKRRHVSTFVQSHDTQIETFLHGVIPEGLDIAGNDREDADFWIDLLHDPEMKNSFNQQKRKEIYKNKLRNKFRERYGINPKDFENPCYRRALFETASKEWLVDLFNEDFNKVSRVGFDKKNILNSNKSASTTVAVSTCGVLTGRIVTSSRPAAEVTQIQTSVPGANEVKSKSKKSKKKKKTKQNSSSNVNTKSVPLCATSIEKKADAVKEAKVDSVEVQEDENSSPLFKGKTSVQQDLESKYCNSTKSIALQESIKVASNLDGKPIILLGDGVEYNKLCFGGMSPQDNSGHECSKTECGLKACCSFCQFDEKSSLNKTDTTQKSSSITITEKKANTIKSTLKNSASKGRPDKLEQVKDSSYNLKESTTTTVNIDSKAKHSEPVSASPTDLEDNQMIDLTLGPDIPGDISVYKNKPSKKEIVCNELTGSLVNNPDKGASATNDLEDTNDITFDDTIVDEFLTLIGAVKKNVPEEEANPDCAESAADFKIDPSLLDKKFKTCAFCGKREVTYKTFKRCAKCKAENFPQQLYYCCRQCQIDDWQESHRDEHARRRKQ